MKIQRHSFSAFLFGIGALLLALTPGAIAAAPAAETVKLRTISLGMVSEVPPVQIEEHFRDFVRYVARKLSSTSDIEGKVVVAPTALQLAKLLEEKKVDFYLESPYPTYVINGQGAAQLLLRRWKSGMAVYHSVLFRKKDGGATRLEDLRGKMIALEDPGSTSGYFLPKMFLLRKGLRLTEKPTPEAKVSPKEIGYVFTYSAEKIVDLVLSSKVAGGAISNDDYGRLDEKKRAVVAILAETEDLPRHLLSIRKDLPAAAANRLRGVLLSMHQDEEGRKILEKTDNTTKFDILPGGEESVRRKFVEVFRSRDKN